MKNYNEMANDVFRRRDEYEADQKKKRKMITRTAASLCCVCFVALIGIGIWQSGWINSTPVQTIDDALYPGIKDTFDVSKGESPDDPQANNKIIIHKINGVSANKLKLNLVDDDFVEMDAAAVNEYYGINIFPTVPDDIKEWEDQNYGIYKRNSGTGEVYWDGTVLNYSNDDFSRSVNIEIDKGGLPPTCCAIFDELIEKSIINNVEVGIAISDNGYYYAEFMHKNVGFRIIIKGLSEAEMVSVIASLIK